MKGSRIGRIVASTVLAVGLWTGTAGAESTTGKQVLEWDDAQRTFYILGVIDGNELACPRALRKGTMKAQAIILMGEHPDAHAPDVVAAAMLQLGCWLPKPASAKVPA